MADAVPISLPSSAAGRTSGKGWKDQKTPTMFVSNKKNHPNELTTKPSLLHAADHNNPKATRRNGKNG